MLVIQEQLQHYLTVVSSAFLLWREMKDMRGLAIGRNRAAQLERSKEV
jgi:hypothetical protein